MQIAIIPARGGSKRIPKKSIRPFLGKPLIAYTIEAAVKSGFFDHILVSTDSEEFADIAREYGAEVPFMRPAELADDSPPPNRLLTMLSTGYGKTGASRNATASSSPIHL